jgi:hypothetical protein
MASRLHLFETEMLDEGENLMSLICLNRALLGRAPKRGISSPPAISPFCGKGIVWALDYWRIAVVIAWLSTTRGVRMESDQIRRDGHGPLDPPPGLRNRQAEGLL